MPSFVAQKPFSFNQFALAELPSPFCIDSCKSLVRLLYWPLQKIPSHKANGLQKNFENFVEYNDVTFRMTQMFGKDTKQCAIYFH